MKELKRMIGVWAVLGLFIVGCGDDATDAVETGSETAVEEGGEATEEEGGEEGGEGEPEISECGALMGCAEACEGYGLDDAYATLNACLDACTGEEASDDLKALLNAYAMCLDLSLIHI